MTVADSFVMPSNKLGSGNGEAKFYVGNDGDEVRDFFGPQGFSINCFMLRDDLLKYLVATEPEYRKPEQPYRRAEQLPQLWQERLEKIRRLPEVISFPAQEQVQIGGPRVYINSQGNPYYALIREVSLPNITYIAAIKLRGEDGAIRFYLRLFVDYFGGQEHPSETAQAEAEIANENIPKTEKDQLSKARVGQGKYREDLLHECPFCPITMVSDDRLLIASHIKPWKDSSDKERLDPKNGLLLTPTYDRLFDIGLITFDNDKRMLVSPFLSRMTCSKLSLLDKRVITHLPLEGRKSYMEYHRDVKFKRAG
jgi:hypothetical protein